jgi:hypothetical protein
MNRSGRFGAKGDIVDTTHKIKAATATLTVGFLLAIAFAATAQAANGTSQGLTAQQRQAVRARADATNRYYQLGVYSPRAVAATKAEELRAEAMNRFYHLGTASSSVTAVQQAERRRAQAMDRYYHLGVYRSTTAAVQRADERRAQAMDRFYHLGSYALVTTSSSFDWRDAGVGAGGMLGLVILAGALTVLVRRRAIGQPSSPSTT